MEGSRDREGKGDYKMIEFRITSDRMNHMHGVAEYMYAKAQDYDLDAEEMYLLGLLHDIGYLQGHKEGHEKYGGKLCFSKLPLRGVTIEYCIEHHNCIPENFSWSSELSRKQYLLLEADMSVTGKGEICGFDGRLEDIAKRYGQQSETYKECDRIIKWLKSNRKKK